MATIFCRIKTGAFPRALSVYPSLARQARKFLPNRLIKKRVAHYKMSKDKVTHRLATKTSWPDFMSYILRYNDERGMQIPEIEVNAGIIIQAGSETAATVLATCLFFTHRSTHNAGKEVLRRCDRLSKRIFTVLVAHIGSCICAALFYLPWIHNFCQAGFLPARTVAWGH